MSKSVLHFDPDLHPEDTLKQFNAFKTRFELRYNAEYPDPPKASLENAITRWKLEQTDTQISPSAQEYDSIRNDWVSKDKVAKFLGIFSSERLYEDWLNAIGSVKQESPTKWEDFVSAIQNFYKPTENIVLRHFQFRSIFQLPSETFTAFCNRVEKEAKTCSFTCDSEACTAQNTVIRDQIIIGTINTKIQEEALNKSWDLKTLKQKGMHLESALKSAASISGDKEINKIGRYSQKFKNRTVSKRNPLNCFSCGASVSIPIMEHVKTCPAKKTNCSSCGKKGHYEKVCRSKSIKSLETDEVSEIPLDGEEEEEAYSINIFALASDNTKSKWNHAANPSNFQVQVIVNNNLETILADTGAKVSVCGEKEAKRYGLLDRMTPSSHKLKPYKSATIPVQGIARCAVTFGSTSIPVEWNIIDGTCQPILSGNAAKELGIITFKSKPPVFAPINMIEAKDVGPIQDIISRYPQCFEGIGKLKGTKVKLHVKQDVKPVIAPPLPIPYHLRDRADKIIKEMIQQEIIEEHPSDKPAPWISNCVLSPKPDDSLRVTLDARNVNKAIESSNLPIPRLEDIKAALSGCTVFSKIDLKSAFWQIELEESSRYLTVFRANNKLYRYRRLTMGLKPAQGELNSALAPLFNKIPNAHLIHDDVVIGGKGTQDHDKALIDSMEAIYAAGVTLNGMKCVFGVPAIQFWGLIISKDGIGPDPEKVKALNDLTLPDNKNDLISFLCMMQAHSEFIPNFARKASLLRELIKKNRPFKWEAVHTECFEDLIKSFKEATLLQYFDMNKKTFVLIDAHKSGLGAMLAQGSCIEDALPIAVASRTTNDAEQRYPQIDLEAMGFDFALRRFRMYLVGSPSPVEIVTDHKPLKSIFNGNRKGSVRTERVKLRHQDIQYNVSYQKGKINQADYLSRHATSLKKLPSEQQNEADDLNKILYMLHTTPVMDHIGLATIANETRHDKTLQELIKLIRGNATHLKPVKNSKEISRYRGIFSELTVTGNGILLKGERIVLPASLQERAVELAHRGAHPGQSGMLRRLRAHFFFFGMATKVKDLVSKCKDCSIFVDKKTQDPIVPHKISEKCWEKVSVDLYGPMPSSNHIIVVQDTKSRFPSAKLVSSTSADKVIPKLTEIYDCYGDPDIQISDNGPPFQSKKMNEFAKSRDINLRYNAPYHPASNPVENFMRPLGKAMKTNYLRKGSEAKALQDCLDQYRQTPHPATGISPGNFLFRDGLKSKFPRTRISDNQVQLASQRDKARKEQNELQVNESKYRKESKFLVGDLVLLRNHQKKVKFDPIFQSEPFVITGVDKEKNLIEVQNGTQVFIRHPDDLKACFFSQENDTKDDSDETNEDRPFPPCWPTVDESGSDEPLIDTNVSHSDITEEGSNVSTEVAGHYSDLTVQTEPTQRRSTRATKPNQKYTDFVTN